MSKTARSRTATTRRSFRQLEYLVYKNSSDSLKKEPAPKLAKTEATQTSTNILITQAILPAATRYDDDGSVVYYQPAEPCAELLTETEAIRYLRLDTIAGLKRPGETLARYRASGMLRGTQVSKAVFYRRIELDRFLETLTETNPR